MNVSIPAAGLMLEGDLELAPDALGIVVFVHGSGSSRHSTRNRFVAATLRQGGLATLLFDLLTAEEEEQERFSRHLRFDIALLARRLGAVTDWLSTQPQTRHLPIGYFGASTGGGAALVAAAARPEQIRAVVSRGGRPDLAGDQLARVSAPTLLIVGSADTQVLDLNRQALARLGGEKQLAVVAGASHLFEEPGTLEEAAQLARAWFQRYLSFQTLPIKPPRCKIG
jgi:putative phosphoribosyl transferase